MILCLEGNVKASTENQAFVRAWDSEVDGHLLIETGHFWVVHKCIDVNQVEDEALYLPLERRTSSCRVVTAKDVSMRWLKNTPSPHSSR